MLSVFFILCFLCLVRRLLSFFCRSSLLRVACLKKFSGANFCFWVVGVGLVFFGGFLPMFLLYFLAVRSRKCLEKFS